MSLLLRTAEGLLERLRAWRRHLHAHPELSGREEQTARYVAEELRKMGYEPQERFGGGHGIVVDIAGGSGPALALRADMDALPIQEESGVDFASCNPGVMHACGHDAHMAMMLGAAGVLASRRAELKCPVRLIFQPSEEAEGGAEPMIAAGVLEGVGAIYGLHIWSEMPCGTLGTRVGPFMASPNTLRIVVRGAGGHAAMPQQCIDPVVIAAEIILALQTVVSRSLSMTDSAVVSVTKLRAGSATNIIPDEVELNGTIRILSEATFARVSGRVRELAEGIARAHGGTAEVRINRGYPVLVNDRGMVDHLLGAARGLGFEDDELITLPTQGGGEDFAFYAQQRPAGFAFLGARNEATGCCHPHHHPQFNIDERALPLGTALLAQLAFDPPVMPPVDR